MTIGVLVLLYIAWDIWLGDYIVGVQQRQASVQLSQQWNRDDGLAPPTAPSQTPTAPPSDNSTTAAPVDAAPTKNGQDFAMLIVPRFGSDFYRQIAQGTDNATVLQKGGGRIGHYDTTPMPGAIGNVAIASHRTAFGGAFHNIIYLHVGDSIYIETKSGWYRYIYRNTEYVQPTQISVIAPVPDQLHVVAADRLLTMTTCNPILSTKERMAAFAVFADFTPRSAGPPAAIAATVNGQG